VDRGREGKGEEVSGPFHLSWILKLPCEGSKGRLKRSSGKVDVLSWLGFFGLLVALHLLLCTVRQKRLRSWYKNKLELSKLVAKEERKKAVAAGTI
jgi:hypothetical protein